jgi:hypothetical protein
LRKGLKIKNKSGWKNTKFHKPASNQESVTKYFSASTKEKVHNKLLLEELKRLQKLRQDDLSKASSKSRFLEELTRLSKLNENRDKRGHRYTAEMIRFCIYFFVNIGRKAYKVMLS